MGDFNIPKMGDKLFTALTSRGLQVSDALVNLKVGDQVIGGSNLGEDARYDQILHLPTVKKRFSNAGGTLDFFGSDAGINLLFPDKRYTRQKFSFQLSDHFPLWVQIKTDIEGERLNKDRTEQQEDLAQETTCLLPDGLVLRAVLYGQAQQPERTCIPGDEDMLLGHKPPCAVTHREGMFVRKTDS
jgi:hypothetical protein